MELLYYKSLASFAGAALCVAALIYLQVKPLKIKQKKNNFSDFENDNPFSESDHWFL